MNDFKNAMILVESGSQIKNWTFVKSLKMSRLRRFWLTQACTIPGLLGHLWSRNDVIMLWLRLTVISNCLPHLHETLPHKPFPLASTRQKSPLPRLSREFNCEEWAYRLASNILRKSQVPVFVLPGDNNVNDCNNILNAKELWTKYFRRIDER